MQKATTKLSFPRGFIHRRSALDDLLCDKCDDIFGMFFFHSFQQFEKYKFARASPRFLFGCHKSRFKKEKLKLFFLLIRFLISVSFNRIGEPSSF